MSEETRGLLSYRIITSSVDVTLRPQEVSEDSVSWTALGGCETASLTVRRRATDFPNLGSQSRLVVSSPAGDILWEGYISDPGDHDDDDGDGLKLSAVGSMVRATDVVQPLVYLDADMGSWEASAGAASSARADVGDGLMQFGFQSGYPINTGYVAGFDYRRLAWSPQSPGGVVFTYSCGVAAGYSVDVVALDANNGASTVATWAASTSTVTRTVNGFPAGTKSVRLQMRRTGAATNVVGELAVTKVTSVVFIGSRVDRFGVAATDSATSISSAKVVEDLIGRGVLAEVEPAAAIVEDSAAVYTQLAFPEGARGSAVLEELRKSDSQMMWQYGPRALGGLGGFEFTWRRWPTTSRYDLTDEDAIDRPGGEDESCQRITVYYTDLAGVKRYETVQVETPTGARVRDADPLTLETPTTQADAISQGQAALAALANRAAAGTAVVSRLVQDRDTATSIEPFEVRPGYCALVNATGEVVQVTGVEWSSSDGSVATLAIGETGATLDDKIAQVVRGELVPSAPLIPLPAPTPPPLIPTGLPTTDPTDPPSSSPTPVLFSGPAYVSVVVPPVTDPRVQIDLHVSATGTGSPDSTTLKAQDVSGLVNVDTLPDGVTKVPPDSDTFFALVARNVAGTATASAWVPSRSGQVDPANITLAVPNLVAANVVAEALKATGIQIGNGTWDTTQFTFPGVLTIPTNGDPLSITAQANLVSAVMNNIRITAGSNFIEGGLDLANGVSAPTVKPLVAVDWSTPLALARSIGSPLYNGLARFGTNWYIPYYSSSTPSHLRIRVIPTSGLTSGIDASPLDTNFVPFGGMTRLGSEWFIFGYDAARSYDRYVYRYDADFNKIGEFGVATLSTVGDGKIATDGTSLFVAYIHQSTGQLRVNQYTTAGALVRYDILDSDFGTKVRGLYVGPAWFGSSKYAVAHPSGVRVYNNAGGASGATQTPAPTFDLPAPNGENVYGLAWVTDRFTALGVSGNIWRYARRATAESHTFTYSFFDADAGGTGQHETQPGLSRSYTAPAGTWIRVDMDPPSDGGGNDDPDSLRVYIDNHRQADLTPGQTMAVYDTFDLTGPVGQTINGFASLPQSIGSLRSLKADGLGRVIDLEGSGDGRTGPLSWNSAGALTRFAAPTYMQSGTASVSISAAASGFVDVTFPTSFGATPTVVATVANTATCFAVVSARTATGVRITAARSDGTSVTQTVSVQWIATVAA